MKRVASKSDQAARDVPPTVTPAPIATSHRRLARRWVIAAAAAATLHGAALALAAMMTTAVVTREPVLPVLVKVRQGPSSVAVPLSSASSPTKREEEQTDEPPESLSFEIPARVLSVTPAGSPRPQTAATVRELQRLTSAHRAIPVLPELELDRATTLPRRSQQLAQASPRLRLDETTPSRSEKMSRAASPPAEAAIADAPASTPSEASAASHGADVDQLPRRVFNPAPTYPRAALLGRRGGRVVLRVRVDARGHVEDLSIYRSSGNRTLDGSALDAVRRWRFEPALRDDKPVPCEIAVPINFRIRVTR